MRELWVVRVASRAARPCVAMAAAGAMLCAAGDAAADDKFSVENLAPATSQRTSIISVYGTQTLKLGEWEVNAFGSYARRPLSGEDEDGDRVGDLVGSIGTINLMGTVGLTDWLDVSLSVPVHRTSEGSVFTARDLQEITLNDLDGNDDEADSGFGDIRIVPRARIYQNGGFGLGLVASIFLPTGKDGSFMSEPLRLEPRVALDYLTHGVRIAANVGYLVRDDNKLLSGKTVGGDSVDDSVTYGVGVDAPLVSVLHVVAEVDGNLGILADDFNKSQAPMEWRAGPRIVHGGWLAQLGAGTAFVRGIGAPAYRLYASIGYAGLDTDADDDGIEDKDDKCVDQAEDKDAFEDQDGCPELDNDHDGIEDAKDGAPNDAEDKDGFSDEDGVPDADNDQDGVPDASDKAPNEPEDKDGFEDADGAPEADNDGDSVLDAQDGCPLVAGLPEDGGCAPKDGDNDGVIDRQDRCPTEPGLVQNAGCPLVQVTEKKLEIGDKVYFDTNAAVIQERSFALLDAIAKTLADHPEVEQVSVEGHTDNQGKPFKNLSLSKKRAAAVVKYLTDKGVDAKRLKSQGFGQDKPIASNDTEDGQGQNRRVEFVITKRNAETPAATTPAAAPAAEAPAAPAAKP